MKRTARGFHILEFTDHYGEKCSLQKSSLADVDAIWLGVDNVTPKVLASQYPMYAKGQTTGWVNVPLPPDASTASRMHLTQEHVRTLLPYLIRFAETGELPAKRKAPQDRARL